jgi:hypothetical protein
MLGPEGGEFAVAGDSVLLSFRGAFLQKHWSVRPRSAEGLIALSAGGRHPCPDLHGERRRRARGVRVKAPAPGMYVPTRALPGRKGLHEVDHSRAVSCCLGFRASAGRRWR